MVQRLLNVRCLGPLIFLAFFRTGFARPRLRFQSVFALQNLFLRPFVHDLPADQLDPTQVDQPFNGLGHHLLSAPAVGRKPALVQINRPVFLVNAAKQHRVDAYFLRRQAAHPAHEVRWIEVEVWDARRHGRASSLRLFSLDFCDRIAIVLASARIADPPSVCIGLGASRGGNPSVRRSIFNHSQVICNP